MSLETKPTANSLQLTDKDKFSSYTVSGKPIAVRSGQHQSGWLMPVAAFIVVVMGLLAAGMGVVSSQTSIASAQEQISIQAFYAAEAGAQFGMSRLFYDSAAPISRATATAACTVINGNTINFSVAGMQSCQSSIACQTNVDGADTTSFYQISSVGSCGGSPVSAQRTVDVSAFLQ